MVWKLENKNNEIVKYLLPNNLCIVGRASADLIVIDKSVSRKHASLIWNSSQNFIDVQDYSKFGTYINKHILKDKKGHLQTGDIITFGAQPGIDYRCTYDKFNVITSSLITSDKILLKKYLSLCGGSISNNWNEDMEYLVMSNLKITYKVICALIKQIKIVNIDFIKDILEYFQGSRTDQPNVEGYLPKADISDIPIGPVSYKPEPKRQSLFKNKIFYFLSQEKLMRLEDAIVSGGGKTVLLSNSSCNDPSLPSLLASPDSLVMFELNINHLVKTVYLILKANKRRPIIDSEIGFAVLHVSIDDYCNGAKSCNPVIYSELNLSLTVPDNPFRIDNIDSSVPSMLTASLKRTLNHETRTVKRIKSELLADKTQDHVSTEVDLDVQLPNFRKSPLYNNGMLRDGSGGSEYRGPINKLHVDNKENICSEMNAQPDILLHKSLLNKTRIDSKNDDEFDNTCMPIIPGNQNPVTRPFENLDNKQNTANQSLIRHKPSGQDLEKSNPYFSNCRSIEMIPVEFVGKQHSVINDQEAKFEKSGTITRFVSLVKETYPGNQNFKKFKKVSPVFFNTNTIEMFVARWQNY